LVLAQRYPSPTYGAKPVDNMDNMTQKMPVQRHKCPEVSEW